MGLATSVEHAEFARAAFLEIVEPRFTLKDWQLHVQQIPIDWIVNARSTFDHLGKSTSLGDDKRLAIDVAALREIKDKDPSQTCRWLPGPQMPADILTKFEKQANEALSQLAAGTWCLVEQSAIKEHRAGEAEKRRDRKQRKKLELEDNG